MSNVIQICWPNRAKKYFAFWFYKHTAGCWCLAAFLLAQTCLGAGALDMWNRQYPAVFGGNSQMNITYGNGQFAIAAYNTMPGPGGSFGGCFLTSTDGVNWTTGNFPTSFIPSGIAFGHGQFVVIGNDGMSMTPAVATSGQVFFPMSEGGSSTRTYFPIPATDNWGTNVYAYRQYDAFVTSQSNKIATMTGNAQILQQSLVNALIQRRTNYTITSVGCKLTSLCMAVQYLGYTNLPNKQPITPGTLNDWLTANGGYTPATNLTRWSTNRNKGTISARLAGADIEGPSKSVIALAFPGLVIKNATNEAQIIDALKQNNPVMLRVATNQHSVFAYDFRPQLDGSYSYEIIDPANRDGTPSTSSKIGDGIFTIPSCTNKTLSQLAATNYLNRTWILSKTGVSDGEGTIHCPLGIQVTDPSGAVATFSASSGLTTNQINGAGFNIDFPNIDPDENPWTGVDVQNYIASFPPMAFTISAISMQQKGTYQIRATGLADGDYGITFDGPYLQAPLRASGHVTLGQVLVFNVSNTPSIKLNISGVSTNGDSIILTGPTGNYTIDTSTNLNTWTAAGSVSVDASGQATFTNTPSLGNSPKLFYKAHNP